MNKLTMTILFLAFAASAQERSPASVNTRRELSNFGPFAAYSSLVEGMTSDERIIFLKTPVMSFRLPVAPTVSFGPLRPPSTLFAVDPLSVP